jgi:hypothetical protein
MTDPRAESVEQEVGDRLRELAANIMRVTRGSGRVFEISLQANAFLDAMTRYRDVVGYYPHMDRLKKALRTDDPVATDRMPADKLGEVYARRTIVRGALQVAASRLLDQSAEAAAGEAEILKGIREFEKVEEAARQRKQAEQDAALAALRAAQKARRQELKELRNAEEARKAAARERRAKKEEED